jgi:DNA-binding winged helix-turn-helix (wHTH) protein
MSECVRFGDCVLNIATRELTRGGLPQPLSPKAFTLLTVLAERRPAAVSHDDLRKVLWPDMEVGGTTLARLVNEVRTAVGDHADHPHVIRTVPRFGYAFCSETDPGGLEPEPKVYCAVQWGTQHIPLPPGTYVIGRGPDAPISVPASNVSRRHAQIVVTASGATLEDLGSRNGTSLGGSPISGRVDLKHQDRIVIGPATLVFQQSDEAETTTGD